jgi:hypothetical protein
VRTLTQQPQTIPILEHSQIHHRTLSQIPEDYDLEDDLSYLLSKDTMSLKHQATRELAPRVTMEIEQMESEFNQFLEQVYT